MIKFPRMHIAQSVTNRILNIAAGMPDQAPVTPVTDRTPEPIAHSAEGLRLSQQLSAPLAGPMPGINDAPDPGGTAAGSPLLETILEPES